MDDVSKMTILALAEADSLREMFEHAALSAAERRIAHSIDGGNIAGAMFFLDVYNFVNGSDVVTPKIPVAQLSPRVAPAPMVSTGASEHGDIREIWSGPHFNQREALSRLPAND